MVAYANNAEGGTEGATVTTGNSGGASGTAWSSVVTDSGPEDTPTIVYARVAAYRGSLGYRVISSYATQVGLFTKAFTAGYQRLRFYVRLSSYPTAEPSGLDVIQFVEVIDGTGGIPGYLYLDAAGRLLLIDANGNAVAQTTNGLPLRTWLRIELIVDPDTTGSGGKARFCYAVGDGSPVETIVKSGLNLGTAGTVSRFGLPKPGMTANLPELWLDEIAYDSDGTNTTFIGPSSAGRFRVGATTPNLYLGSTAVGAVWCGTTQLYP